VVLADPRGTLWNGSALLVLTGGTGSKDATALPSRLAWSLRPHWRGASLALRTPCCITGDLRIVMRPRWAGMALDIGASQVHGPAATIAGLGTPWNTLQFDGELHLSTQGLSVEWSAQRLALAGQAELVARNMSSRLSTLRPMGSYRITLQGGSAPALQLATLDGSLQLAGSGQWVGGRLRFRGDASADPAREAALSNLLNILGQRNGPRSIISIG
jgi:general secretion pathway protein N